jgi:hypothetical protein
MTLAVRKMHDRGYFENFLICSTKLRILNHGASNQKEEWGDFFRIHIRGAIAVRKKDDSG